MILAVAVFLLLVFSSPFFFAWIGGNTERDVLSPIRVVAALHIITVVPYVVLLHVDPTALSSHLQKHPSIPSLDVAVTRYAFVHALGFVVLLIGLKSRVADRLAARLPVIGHRHTPARSVIAASAALAIGLGAFGFLLTRIGGYQFLLDNISKRTQLLAGLGYVYTLLWFLAVGTLVLLYSARFGNARFCLLLACGAALVSILIFSSFGGRGHSLKLLVLMMFTYHYAVRRIKRPKLLGGILAVMVIPYFIAIPIIRAPGGMNMYRGQWDRLWTDVRGNLDIAIKQTSYVDHYLLVVNHFTPERLWLGSTYLGLVTAPIPSSIYPDKPPVDDGVYLNSLAVGMDVRPPMPFRDLYPSSWPPETLGTTYMNFWIPGVIVGMFLLGMFYRVTYVYMRLSEYSLFSIVVYGYVLLTFHLSVLRIIQTGIFAVQMAIFFGLFFGWKYARRRVNRPAASSGSGSIRMRSPGRLLVHR